MLRSDYIRRILEQLGRSLSRVRELVAEGDVKAGLAELERTASTLGIPAPLAHAMSDETLTAVLRTAGRPDVPKQVVVAELFFLAATAARERGAVAESDRLLARARRLYAELTDDADALAALGVDGRLEEIDRLLDGGG